MTHRFLFVMVEAGGNVPAQLSVARRLSQRGHSVFVLSDPAIEAEVEVAGCTFIPFERAPHQNARDPARDIIREFEAKSPIGKLRRVADALMFGPAEAYARDTLAAIERVVPDAVAVDCLPFGASVGAEKSGVPAATLFHFVYNAPVRGVTPFGLGLQPARGPFGRARDRVLTGITKLIFRKGLRPVNAARVNLGLPPLGQVFDQFHRLTRELVLTSREFDFVAPGLPDRVRYVGAQLDDPSWAEAWTSPWTSEDQRPLVVVSLGTTEQQQRPVLGRVIDALGGLPVRGLVTLGGQSSTSDFSPPPNVQVVSSARHADVLPQASAMVCHGGHGSVMKALAYGIPLVVVPLGRDQFDNAARVVARGAGVAARARSTPSALRAAIQRVLTEPGFRAAAGRLRAAIERDARQDRAVHELEDLASLTAAGTTRRIRSAVFT